MKVHIIGNKGNMGRRYSAICTRFDVPFDGSDRCERPDVESASHVIIATPTNTHVDLIRYVLEHSEAKILCEKPIEIGPALIANETDRLFMVNNYAYCAGSVPRYEDSRTEYNYYHSGPHGLVWDCIQLVHLAAGSISLRNENPVWKCVINGFYLERSQIDSSYVVMLFDFLADKPMQLWGSKDIIEAHAKALHEESHNRYPSEIG